MMKKKNMRYFCVRVYVIYSMEKLELQIMQQCNKAINQIETTIYELYAAIIGVSCCVCTPTEM